MRWVDSTNCQPEYRKGQGKNSISGSLAVSRRVLWFLKLSVFFFARVGLKELEEKFTYFQTQMEERAAKSANLNPTVEER